MSELFVSHAQNFEDVILWRALKHIENGTYVDVGAQDPVVDSVSLAFYERGWRGVHVDASPRYAAALRAARPDETVIEAAVGDGEGVLAFYDIPDTGLSTGDPEIAARHEAEGRVVRRIKAARCTLDEVLAPVAGRDIHWLKIDVEGMEASVIESWRGEVRPWVVVVEATRPNSSEQNHQLWEPRLLARGYSFVYFDGLNRFYVSDRKPELSAAFAAGPNFFDNFALSGEANAPFASLVKSRLNEARSAAARLEEQIRKRDASIVSLEEALSGRDEAVTAARNQIAILQEALSDRDEAAVAARNQIAALEEALGKRDEEVMAARDQIVALQDTLRTCEEATLSASRELSALQEALRERDEDKVSASRQIDALQEAMRNRDALVEALTSSTSWKLTAPMRFARMTGARVKVGTVAWLTFKPGARPHRFVSRNLARARVALDRHPRAKGILKRLLRRMPVKFGSAEPIFDMNTLGLVEQRLRAACKAVKANKTEGPKSSRPLLAFVSPLPPDRNGVADYSAALLPALANYYRIHGVVQGEASRISAIEGVERIISEDEFLESATSYDRVVYNVGNSLFHHTMFELARNVPGIVVFHDIYLGHVLAHLELYGGWNSFWSKALYLEGGYPALLMRHRPNGIQDAILAHPASFFLGSISQGMIVTSNHAAEELDRLWHGALADRTRQVRLAQTQSTTASTDEARRTLGLKENVFVVCTFGHVNAFKAVDTLIRAFKKFASENPNALCKLIFVGGGDQRIVGDLEQLAYDAKIYFELTGYVSPEIYELYLSATDVAVQLRSQTRGESSGTALDAMAAGVPLVVNALGSMAELPGEAVFKLGARPSESELADALRELYHDQARRGSLSRAAKEAVECHYSPAAVAVMYRDAIEDLVESTEKIHQSASYRDQAEVISRGAPNVEAEIAKAATRLVQSGFRIPCCGRRLFFDVSLISHEDYRSGIQRVIRSQLLHLLESCDKMRIEPVRLVSEPNGRWGLVYARNYTCDLLGIGAPPMSDEKVEPRAGDVYLGADYFTHAVVDAEERGMYSELKKLGTEIYFSIYDNLPVFRPDFFPEESSKMHARWLHSLSRCADGLICISETVAQSTRRWLQEHAEVQKPIRIQSVHLGADVDASAPTRGLPDDAPIVLAQLQERPTFLMVGTIEPRKGYLQSIKAFEELWAAGVDVNLVIVGAEGWKQVPEHQRRTIPGIISRLQASAERGKKLFWLAGISDEYLEEIYARSHCLIAASEDEGFGLPLIEAARHKLPILARDTPIFREVAGSHAAYFSGLAPEDLTAAIQEWLASFERGAHIRSDEMPWLTWEQSVERLQRALGITSGNVGRASVENHGASGTLG